MDESLKLLVNNGYFVKLCSVDNGAVVTFPANLTMDQKEVAYEYYICGDEDESLGIVFGHNGQYKKYVISPDCVRLAILCDIIVKCNSRGLKRKLIVAYDKEHNHVADVLGAIHENPQNVKKEEKLFHLVSSRHLNDDTKSVANKEGMLEEYNDIVAIYNRRNGLTV